MIALDKYVLRVINEVSKLNTLKISIMKTTLNLIKLLTLKN